MMIRPSGSPNSCCREASACRAMAISVSTAAFVQQHRRGFIPAERRALHAAAFGADHRIQAQPHLVGTFGRNQQHAALALDDMPQKRLAGPECSRQIKHNEGFAGAPLAAQQPMTAGRDQMFDQPALDRPRIRIAVCKQCRQLRILLRWWLIIILELRIIILQLGIPGASGCGGGAFASKPLAQPLPNSGADRQYICRRSWRSRCSAGLH